MVRKGRQRWCYARVAARAEAGKEKSRTGNSFCRGVGRGMAGSGGMEHGAKRCSAVKCASGANGVASSANAAQ